MRCGNTVYQKWRYSGKGTVDSRDSITVKLSYGHHCCFFGFSGDSMNETEVVFFALCTLEALYDTWLPMMTEFI